MHRVENVRISTDGGLTWHHIDHAWQALSWSYEAPQVQDNLAALLEQPITLTIHSTPIAPNPFYSLYHTRPRWSAHRWPDGARAEARRQRKRRAQARQKRQKRA